MFARSQIWEVNSRHLMKVHRSAHKCLFLLFLGHRTISDSQGICIEPIGHHYVSLIPVQVLDRLHVVSRCGWRPVPLHQTCSPAKGRHTIHVNPRVLTIFNLWKSISSHLVEYLSTSLTGCRMCLELPSSKQDLICLRRFTMRTTSTKADYLG